ncbi:hypothetical protein HKD37_13G035295 [Glycine soja]
MVVEQTLVATEIFLKFAYNYLLGVCLALFRRLNSISKINDDKETWKIVVPLINMWTIPISHRFSIEQILIDKENVDVQMGNVNFQVGQTYVIYNFEVKNNSATKITMHKIPKTMYNFTVFDAIVNGSATPDYLTSTIFEYLRNDIFNMLMLLDVIGEVVEIGQCNLHGMPKKVVFTMKYESYSLALAMKLKDCLDKHVIGPMLLLLNMTKIKETSGYSFLSFNLNIFVNNDMKEIVEFKDRMDPSQLTMIPCAQKGSQIFGSSLYSVGDHFLHNAHVKCFDEVSQVKKECMCVTVATITKLLVANGWIYDVCPKCNKKVFLFICVGCGNESTSIIPNFRVEVRVAQPHEPSSFTLWDCECYALINKLQLILIRELLMRQPYFKSSVGRPRENHPSEDVALQLGLKIDGLLVTGFITGDLGCSNISIPFSSSRSGCEAIPNRNRWMFVVATIMGITYPWKKYKKDSDFLLHESGLVQGPNQIFPPIQ